MRILLVLLVISALGCQQVPKPGASQEQSGQPVAEGQSAPTGENQGIQPMTSAPIATAPVSGSESLQGGG
ncbi:MAG TPA: hypothetical protein PKA27_08135 [Fimbriimonadaceae bacterium]|nr:hypothetical protein [Fimbriimonadaceae bacterium]